MKTTPKTTRPSSRKSGPTAPSAKRGNMKPTEIKPLVMAARKAFDRQADAGLVEDGETFDAWRHRQCMDAVSKPGITACNHDDFRPLLAHFQTLAGDDASAFSNLMKSGKPTDHAAAGDTFEARRQLAHTIAQRLKDHIHLAETSRAELLAEAIGEHHQYQEGLPWEGSASAMEFRQLMDRKDAIEAKGKSINVGYLIWLVRQKTRRPDLQLGKDWQSGLADRCTARQLSEIRSTIINRIAAVEGVGSASSRNKSQRSPKAAAARSPRTVAPRQHGGDFL